MARSDSSIGLQNYQQTIAVTTATPLLAPSAGGVYPGLPSPLFPLSTSTYPCGLFIAVPPDISGGVFDGHPFQVSLAAKITGTATTNTLVNLYNAKASSWSAGPAAGTAGGYTIATLGTGTTAVVTGTATAGVTASASINFLMTAQFLWDSVTKILALQSATQYINGAVVAVAATSNVTTVAAGDLNFIPSFTFASASTNTVLVTEFLINRV